MPIPSLGRTRTALAPKRLCTKRIWCLRNGFPFIFHSGSAIIDEEITPWQDANGFSDRHHQTRCKSPLSPQRSISWGGKNMKIKVEVAAVVVSLSLIGCASQQAGKAGATSASASSQESAAASAKSSARNARTVKSKDGSFEGEIIGTPAPGSKFSKLQIGMTMREVSAQIGAADDMVRHETGKRWIPFYYGNDAQRLQASYKNEGCLTYTGGNVFGGGGNELIAITVDAKGQCLDN